MLNTKNAIGKILGNKRISAKLKIDKYSKNNMGFRVGRKVIEKDTGKEGVITNIKYGTSPQAEGKDSIWISVKYNDGTTDSGLGWMYWKLI